MEAEQNIEEQALETGTVLLSVHGDLDRSRALDVQRAVGRAVRNGRTRVVVELVDTGTVAPGVLAALLHARRRLLAMGGDMTLVSERDVLGGQSVIPTVRTVAEARVTPRFGETREAVVDAVGPLRRALVRWAEHAGASAHTVEAVALASSEAITNAVVHAYRDAPAPGVVNVRGELVELARVHIEVSDDGAGMRPRPDSPGLGLGLPLIAQLADSVEIDSCADGGTRVSMDFTLLSGC